MLRIDVVGVAVDGGQRVQTCADDDRLAQGVDLGRGHTRLVACCIGEGDLGIDRLVAVFGQIVAGHCHRPRLANHHRDIVVSIDRHHQRARGVGRHILQRTGEGHRGRGFRRAQLVVWRDGVHREYRVGRVRCRRVHRDRELVGRCAVVAGRIHHLGHILVYGSTGQTAERQAPVDASRTHCCRAHELAGGGIDDTVHKHLLARFQRLRKRTVEHRSGIVGEGPAGVVTLQRALVVGEADDGRLALRINRVSDQRELAGRQALVARLVHDHGRVAVIARGQSIDLVGPVAVHDIRITQQRAAFVDANHITRDEARHRALEQRRKIVRG